MTITFEHDNDVIIYALEKIISYARDNRYIFLAQSVWWISSIIGLQEGLVIHIDNLRKRDVINKVEIGSDSVVSGVHPDRIINLLNSEDSYDPSEDDSESITETKIHNEIIDNCEQFLSESKKEREAIGRKNRQVSRVVKRKAKKSLKTFGTQTEGIDGNELRRRKTDGECQRCAWPQDRKGGHKTLDCYRWKRLEKGTAPGPKNIRYK
jgi:hypothetical protein